MLFTLASTHFSQVQHTGSFTRVTGERSEWQENQFGQNVHWENQSNLHQVIRAILICEKRKENVAQKFKNHSSEMTAREKRACVTKKRQGMFQMLPFLIQ